MYELKYGIEGGRLVKKSDGVPVPEDEPVFILRAKDTKAIAALTAYSVLIERLEQKEMVRKSIMAFLKFAKENPDKMGEPEP